MLPKDAQPGRQYVFVLYHPMGVAHSLPLMLDSVVNMGNGGLQFRVSTGEGDKRRESILYSCTGDAVSVEQVIPVH